MGRHPGERHEGERHREGTGARRRSARAAALGGAALLATAPALLAVGSAWAQDGTTTGELPPGFDAELAADFEAELLDALGAATGQTVDPAGFAALIGAPGDLDLPPGQMATAMATDATAAIAAAGTLGGDSSLTGPCMGLALSFDADGRLIDMAGDFDPAAPPIDLLAFYESGRTVVRAAFTAKNPFTVDVDGFVAYTGVAGAPGAGPRNHTWEITSFGTELDAGGDDNADGDNRNAGSLDLGEQLPAPAKLNALFRIEGSMTADNGFACSGGGYFETTGGAPILEVAGGAMVLVGGLGALFNARPARTWRG